MSTRRIEELRTRRERRDFIEVPRHYRSRIREFVPPLLSEQMSHLDVAKNPFFAHADFRMWVLRDGTGTAVGRISACVDRESLAYHGDATGVFGHILGESEEDVALLLDQARSFLRERGMRRMRGPIDLSTNYTCGLQVSGFDLQPRVDIPQHPEGLGAMVEAAGPKKSMDLLCFHIHRRDLQMERLKRGKRVAEKRSGTTCRRLDLRRWTEELATLHSVYVRCWETNYAFAPMTRDEFFNIAKNFRKVFVDGLCQIAEDDGEAVGFILGLPDVNVGIRACNGRLFPFGWLRLLRAVKKTDRFRVITLGVVPEYRGRGLDSQLIMEHIIDSGPTGYADAELSWVLEDNVGMVKPARTIGAYEGMRLRLYEEELCDADLSS